MNHRELFKIIITIADVHIGNNAISPQEYKYQLKNGVIKKLEDYAFIDGIVLCGDTLHAKMNLDSEYANIFFWFISKIVKIAKSKGAFVRILKGTRSHDVNQLDNVKFYEDDDKIDFRVISTKCIETIDGQIYGHIPEEYVADSALYYDDFFSKPDNYFDMIFMHGLIEECKFHEQKSENHNTKAPIFNVNELIRICKGPVTAGHIHKYMNIQSFYYVGSTLRTCHGEEDPKGYNVIGYVQSKGSYVVERVINEFTFNFNTMKLDSVFIETHTVDEIVKYINNFKNKHNTDKLAVEMKCIDYKETVAKIHLLKKYYILDNTIRINLKIMSEKAYSKEVELEINKVIKSYLKPGLSLIEQIQMWALEERQTKISEADIEKFTTIKRLQREGID